MKEQWKKIDSDAKLLMNVEEGKTLPIKIEIPISAFTSSRDGCCKKLLFGLRLFVLSTVLILLGLTVLSLYTNYFSQPIIQSDKNLFIDEQLLSESKVNKLSLQKKIYETIKKDVENSKSNVVNITTKSIHDTSYSNKFTQYHNRDTILHSNHSKHEIDISESSLKRTNSDKTVLSDRKSVDSKESENNYLQNIKDGFKKIVNGPLPGILLSNNNTLISANESNKDQHNLHRVNNNVNGSSEETQKFLVEIETVDDIVNLLFEEIMNSVLNKQTNDEYIESNEKSIISQEEIKSSEDNWKDSDDNENDSTENTSVKKQFNSSETDAANQDNSFYIKHVIQFIFGGSSIENDKDTSEESISYYEEEKNDNEQNKSSIQEDLSLEKQKKKTSIQRMYQFELNKIINKLNKISMQGENISDEVLKSFSVENSSEEGKLRTTISELSQKIFPYVAEKLTPIVGDNFELLKWYYTNENNLPFLYENDKLKAYTAELLYGTNIRLYVIDLNRVMNIITRDSYNKSYKEFQNSKYNKIQNYIIDRLTKKMDMYNFFLKYNEYETIASSRITILNSIEHMQSDWNDKKLEVNEHIISSSEEENPNVKTTEILDSEGEIRKNYKNIENQRWQLLKAMRKVVDFSDLSSAYTNKDDLKLRKENESDESTTSTEKKIEVADESKQNPKSIVVTTEYIKTEQSEDNIYDIYNYY